MGKGMGEAPIRIRLGCLEESCILLQLDLVWSPGQKRIRSLLTFEIWHLVLAFN